MRMFKGLSLLLIASLPTLPLQADTETIGNVTWKYEIENGIARITGATLASAGTVEIPASLKDTPVTIVGRKYSSLFGDDCDKVTGVTFPSTVTNISDYAFQSCTALSFVNLVAATQLLSIGGYAFDGCTLLETIEIPQSVRTIGVGAFDGCTALTDVILPGVLTSLGESAFFNCSLLQSISMPSNLNFIGQSSFSGCSALTQIVLPANLTAIAQQAFYGCSSLAKITLPRTLTTLQSYSFYGCEALTDVTFEAGIPSGLKNSHILDNVTNVNCPAALAGTYKQWLSDNGYTCTVNNVGEPESELKTDGTWYYRITDEGYAELWCTNSAGEHVCALVDKQTVSANFTLPKTVNDIIVKSIGPCALVNLRGITAITVPSTYESIGDYAFSNCTALATVDLGNGLRYIGKRPFVNTVLSEITLPDSLLDMDGNIIAGAPFGTTITISDSSHFTYSDDGYCLYNKDKTRLYACLTRAEGTVSLPATLQEIKADAFFGCFRLTYLNIPAKVTTIGSKAFNVSGIWSDLSAPESTPKLETVFYQGETPVSNAADDMYDGAPATLTSYAFSDKWTGSVWCHRPLVIAKDGYSPLLTEDYEGIAWTFRIVNNAYAEIYNDGNAAIPTSTASSPDVTAASPYIKVPSSLYGYPVNRIGKGAFRNCNVCSIIILPSTVSAIDDEAFSGCTALQRISGTYPGTSGVIDLPEGIESLGHRVFENDGKLLKLVIPSTLMSINNNPIAGCRNINAIEVASANGYFSFADGVLYDINQTKIIACLSTLTELSLLTTVKEIGDEAFADNALLESVTALCEEPKASDGIFANTPTSLVVKAETASLPTWANYVGKTWKGRTFIDLSDPDAKTKYVDGNGTEWRYAVSNGVAVLTSVRMQDDSALLSLTLPDSIGKYVVKTIASGALANLRGIQSVTVPSTYETIGDYAFSNCTSLASVTLNYGLRAIGRAPFLGTALTSLALPASLTKLDGNPLVGCEFMTTLTIDSANRAFSTDGELLFNRSRTEVIGCLPTMETVTLPATVKVLATNAFATCQYLTTVNALCDAPTADDALFADTPATLVVKADAYLLDWGEPIPTVWKGRAFQNIGQEPSEGIQTSTDASGNAWYYEIIGRNAVIGRLLPAVLPAPSGSVVIPETLDGWPVTRIDSKGFADCSALTRLEIPATVQTIASDAFNGCTALEAFVVNSTNTCYKARNGILYSKDGFTLVKVPAAFRFATTVTETEVSCRQEVTKINNGYDASTMKRLADTITTKTSGRTTTLVQTEFAPAIDTNVVFAGVSTIGDYAFANCGWLPAGSSVNGTVTVTTNGQAGVSRTGLVVMEVGTDSASGAVTTNTLSSQASIVNGKVASTKTLVVSSSAYESTVPLPLVPPSVLYIASQAWTSSIWEGIARTGSTVPVTLGSRSPTSVPEAGESSEDDEEDDETGVSSLAGSTVDLRAGVAVNVALGLDSGSVKSVAAKNLPSGLRLVKTTDKATKKSYWSLVGSPSKAAAEDVTLTVTGTDGVRQTLTFRVAVAAMPAWLTGEFNGVIYDDAGRPLGAARTTVTTLGRISGNFRMPSDDGSKGKTYMFYAAGFTTYDAATSTYAGQAVIRFGSVEKDVTFECQMADDGTGRLVFDFGSGSAELQQNIWKRKDLDAPAYAKGTVNLDNGFSVRLGAKGRVTWTGSVEDDDGRTIRISGSSQLFNDASSLLIYITPRKNLIGGWAELIAF